MKFRRIYSRSRTVYTYIYIFVYNIQLSLSVEALCARVNDFYLCVRVWSVYERAAILFFCSYAASERFAPVYRAYPLCLMCARADCILNRRVALGTVFACSPMCCGGKFYIEKERDWEKRETCPEERNCSSNAHKFCIRSTGPNGYAGIFRFHSIMDCDFV